MPDSIRTFSALFLVGFGLAPTCLAACEIPGPSESVAAWTVTEIAPRTDAPYYHEFEATSPEHPGLAIPLPMDGPSSPRLIEWVEPERYEGRIALLQYFAGEPGTSSLTIVVNNAIVHLPDQRIIGIAGFSYNCEPVEWIWFDDRVEVNDVEIGLRETFRLE